MYGRFEKLVGAEANCFQGDNIFFEFVRDWPDSVEFLMHCFLPAGVLY